MSFKQELNLLRNLYYFIFFIGVGLVVLMHTFDPPALDLFRVPTFIKEAAGFNNLNYFLTFRIYQFTLVFSLFSILLDGVSLSFRKNRLLIKISEYVSILAFVLMLVTLSYFLYNLFVVEQHIFPTAVLYTFISFFLVIVDVLTFRTDKILEAKHV